jgi:hypothetical protein
MNDRALLLVGCLLIIFMLNVDSVDRAQSLTMSQQLTITANMDNTLYESEDGSLSNGAGAHLFAGNTASGQIRRAILAFDLRELIPPEAIVVDAQLNLNVSKTKSGEKPVSLHRVLSSWGEGTSNAPGEEGAGTSAAIGDATWLHRFWDSDLWTTSGGNPGGHFSSEASSTSRIDGTGFYTWTGNALVSDVQYWIAHPDKNFGWIVIGEEEELGTAVRFDSRQHDEPQVHPQLVVLFFVPSQKLYLPHITKG